MSWDTSNSGGWGTGGTSSKAANAQDGFESTTHDNNDSSDFTGGGGSAPSGVARNLDGACRTCGQEGHNNADCPEPKKAQGNCRVCDKEGHFAAECPDKPPDACKNCKQEGHKLADCKEPRAIDRSKIAKKSAEAAWEALVKADKECDMDDVREALQVYVKAVPDSTYQQLEASFRQNEFNTHLIALKREHTDTYTLMDLQGVLDREFTIGYFWGPKPQRGTVKEAWPPTPEENIQRLTNAGIPVDRGIPKCHNCDKLGHVTKNCPDEKVERTDQVTVKCVNCDEEGHRARDCPQPRKTRGGGCRNCGGEGHKASECTEPPNMANVECKHCNEMGHFAKECPTKPKEVCRNCGEEGHRKTDCQNEMNMAIQTCRNCDQQGHMSKTCPKPRDYSRVKCSNCEEMGHTKVRCTKPPAADGFGTSGAGDFGDGGGGFGGGADDGFTTGGAGDGFDSNPTPITAGGGDDGW